MYLLGAESSESANTSEAPSDLTITMTDLGVNGIKQCIEEVWQYRHLRAKANVACLGQTTLGSQMLLLPDYEVPLSFTEHYIRLSNNLVKG